MDIKEEEISKDDKTLRCNFVFLKAVVDGDIELEIEFARSDMTKEEFREAKVEEFLNLEETI